MYQYDHLALQINIETYDIEVRQMGTSLTVRVYAQLDHFEEWCLLSSEELALTFDTVDTTFEFICDLIEQSYNTANKEQYLEMSDLEKRQFTMGGSSYVIRNIDTPVVRRYKSITENPLDDVKGFLSMVVL